MAFTINPAPADPLIEGRAAVGSFPAGVAIDPVRKLALVTESSERQRHGSGPADLTLRGNVAVGRSPAEGIAIDADKSIALVANPGSNNVSVIDLNRNQETRRSLWGVFRWVSPSIRSLSGRW